MLEKLDWNHFLALSLLMRDRRRKFLRQGRILEEELKEMPEEMADAVRGALDDFGSIGFVEYKTFVDERGYLILPFGFEYAKEIIAYARGVFECDVPESRRLGREE